MIETILVATDGSEAASSAEKFGIALAGRLGARLSGCTVVEDRDVRPPNDGGLGVQGFPEGEVTGYYASRAEAAARRLAARARGEGSELVCETTHGSADDVIVARGRAADLAVLGRVGKGAASRVGLVGSTLDAVLRKTSRSALVVPPGASLGGAILLGFDGSPGSRIAARTAVELANRLGEAVHVFVDSKDKGRAIARFEEVRQIVVGLAVPVRETSSTLGRPDVKLVDTAKEAGAGLIVMGAYGRNRITDFFLGSNAAAVARNSPIAVLLAR